MELNLYLKNRRETRWYTVEVAINGKRQTVAEVHAASKHDAYATALKGMSATELNRACDGVTLRILPS